MIRGEGANVGGANMGGTCRGCSCFLMLSLYEAGMDETVAVVGRFALSIAVTGRGASFGLGFKKSNKSLS